MSDKEIKLMIAKECLVAMLSNSGERADCYIESLTHKSWKCATTLVKLSEQEEKK